MAAVGIGGQKKFDTRSVTSIIPHPPCSSIYAFDAFAVYETRIEDFLSVVGVAVSRSSDHDISGLWNFECVVRFIFYNRLQVKITRFLMCSHELASSALGSEITQR